MILWEIATRQTPYKEAHATVIQTHVTAGKREDLPTGSPDGYAELIEQCWDQDPSKRPAISQILSQLEAIRLRLGVWVYLSFLFSYLLTSSCLETKFHPDQREDN